MADPRSPQDERRYSSVILSHPRLANAQDMAHALGPMATGFEPISSAALTVSRFELLSESLLYPGVPERRLREFRRGKVAGKPAFAHESYLATIKSRKHGPLLIFGSPYKSLIRSALTQLNNTLDAPLVRYLRPDMSETFEYLSHQRPGFEVLRIRAQRPDDSNVSTLTLDGTAPLDSDTWVDLPGRKTPYSLTVRYIHADQPVRVHLDRVGNASWYQQNSASAPSACALLTKLTLADLGNLSDISPLARAHKTAGSTEDDDDASA